jgi:hypothetical protein
VIVSQPEFDPIVPGFTPRKQQANIYTVLLIVSLVALLAGCLFLWLEISEYGGWGQISVPTTAFNSPLDDPSRSPVQDQPAIMPSPTLFVLSD